MQFDQLGIIEPILKALQTQGYTTPTPIQQQSIPIGLAGTDLLACAQTGTGKTAAFAIPLLQRLYQQSLNGSRVQGIKALVLTPTRELAIQIEENIAAYGAHLNLRHLVIFGGVSQVPQVQSLRRGVDILIATPGRLLDLVNQQLVSLAHINLFVLDEADRMLDMGFIHDVKRIIAKLPARRQTLFFSATMPPEIAALSQHILHQPQRVEVTPVSSTAEKVAQELYYVDKSAKRQLLLHLLQDAGIRSAIVFTRTKHGADKVAKDLNRANITAEAIHGNKSQNARQRALSNFKTGDIRILVATDIAARGIDIDELSHVINYEIPNVAETYVHRIGRTGRAGASGIAISFCDAEERSFIKDIQKLIGQAIPVCHNHPFVVDAPPAVKAVAIPGHQPRPAQRQGARPSHHQRPANRQRFENGSPKRG